MKKNQANSFIRQTLSLIVPALACFYAQNSVSAQDSAGPDLVEPGSIHAQPAIQSGSQAGVPALNIIPSNLSRPPIPPPPETPQAGQAIALQPKIQPSMPQAWRMKALQLFKANNTLDKNSVLAVHVQAGYNNAFETIARALADSGIKLEALSFSSGHMLLSCQNDRGLLDKAIIALRQAVQDSDSSANSGTDVRVFCDSHNRALTLAQVKAILSQIDSAVEHNKNKPGAETL